MSRQFALSALALAMVLGAGAARATAPGPAFNQPIVFAGPGWVTLTLEDSRGGFDHILELAAAPGAIGSAPLLALTDLAGGPPSVSVRGFTPAAQGASVSLGNVDAGQDFIFRLSNIGSARLGTPGGLDSQVFTGRSSILNPQPTQYYSLVEWIGPTQVRVQMEDVFPENPALGPTSLGAPDLQFLLTLSPISEPRSWALLLAGLVAVGALARRRLG